jgi:hypothetical protein
MIHCMELQLFMFKDGSRQLGPSPLSSSIRGCSLVFSLRPMSGNAGIGQVLKSVKKIRVCSVGLMGVFNPARNPSIVNSECLSCPR